LKHLEIATAPAVAPLAAILRPHLRGAADQAALLLPDLAAIRPGAPRRMATALLEEAIRTGGGTIYRTLGGADLLCGTARPAAIRAAGALSRLLDGGLAPPIWRLPEESAELLTWAAPEYLAPAPARAAEAWPDSAAFQAVLDSLAAEQVLHPQTLRGADGRVPRAMVWSHARIDWDIVLLYGGGLALGELCFSTGLAAAAGRQITGWIPQGPAAASALVAVAALVAVVTSEFTSNVASATMVVPIVIAMGQAVGVEPVAAAVAATMAASLGFMMPVSSPCNAIVYGSGRIPLRAMMLAGVVLDVVGWGVITAALLAAGPLLGR